jgi:hypothetical protein
MKSPIYKFSLFAFVVLLGLSGVNADNRLVEGGSDAEVEVSQNVTESRIAQRSKDELKERRKSDQDQRDFTFPNVFDALRFIF